MKMQMKEGRELPRSAWRLMRAFNATAHSSQFLITDGPRYH